MPCELMPKVPPPSMPTTTGTLGFARSLCISPRLPLSPFFHLSRSKCEACSALPPCLLNGGCVPPFLSRIRSRLDVLSKCSDTPSLELSSHLLCGQASKGKPRMTFLYGTRGYVLSSKSFTWGLSKLLSSFRFSLSFRHF